MKSVRELKESFRALFPYHGSDISLIEGRINCYKCPDNHITRTKEIHLGITPFTHDCDICGKIAVSSLHVDISPNTDIAGEWYRPQLKQLIKLRRFGNIVDHVLSGGLLYRKIDNK